MKWLRWFGWRKKACVYFLTCRCCHSCYAEIILVGITKSYSKPHAWRRSHWVTVWPYFRSWKSAKMSFEGDGGMTVGLTTALIIASHHVSRPFCICLSVMTSLDRECERRLTGSSQRRFSKDQIAGLKCLTKKKKNWQRRKQYGLLSVPSVVCRRAETLRYLASLSS